jgi:hypothetical protein
MKTKIFLLVSGLLIGVAMQAQFSIGVKGGANIVKISGQSFKDQFRYGYNLGGFVELGRGKFTLQPEILFNQYNTTIDSNFKHIYENIFNGSAQSKVKLSYLSVPILLNYELLGRFLKLQLGPQFSILMQQNKTLLQNGADAFKKGDFAMVAGAQVKLGNLRLDGRYIVGLNNINDIDKQDKWKSQGFQLSVGIAL